MSNAAGGSEGELGALASLALAWQPVRSRGLLEGLLALDARLARQVDRAREPLIGQIGLAWWRERLGGRSREHPLLAFLSDTWGDRMVELVPLVDGWEELLGERPESRDAMVRFASGRGEAFAALSRQAGLAEHAQSSDNAGRRWGFAELAFRFGDSEACEAALQLGRSLPSPALFPRPLRGVAVIDGLATRAVERRKPLLSGRAAVLTAFRLGLLGR